jgi:hypothetical protein
MPEGTPSLLPASKKCTKHAKMPFNLPLASAFTPGKCNPRTGIWIRELGAHWYPGDGSAHRRAGERGSQPESRTLRVRVLLTIQRATRQGHFHTRASACRDALAEVLGVEGLGTTRPGKAGGEDCKRHCTGAKGRKTPLLRTRLLRAHADVGLVERAYSWRQWVGVMGGGTDASLRWAGCA